MDMKKIGKVLLIIGIILLTASGIILLVDNIKENHRDYSNNSNGVNVKPTPTNNGNSNKIEIKPTPTPANNNSFGQELIDKIENDDKLSSEEKEIGRVYASHMKIQMSIDKETFMDNLKPNNSNDSIVENDVKTLIAYLNYDIKNDMTIDGYGLSPCYVLSILYPEGYKSNEKVNSLNNMYPAIAECLYGFKYVEVKDDYITSRKLISSEDYEKLKEYFTDVEELKLYDDLWKDGIPEDNQELMKGYSSIIKANIGKGYRVAYEFGDGFGFSGRFFELDGINKLGDNKYTVQISMYYNNQDPTIKCEYCKKIGKLDVEVVNNHLKYGKLIFD